MDDQQASGDMPVEEPKLDDPLKRVRFSANLSVGLALGAILVIGLMILFSAAISYPPFFSIMILVLPLANLIGIGAAITGTRKPYRARSIFAFVLHGLMLLLMICTLLGPVIGSAYGGNTAD